MAIEGKVVAITGATSGIGRQQPSCSHGVAQTLFLGARGEERLRAVATQIEWSGGEVAFRPTNVTRREDLAALGTVPRRGTAFVGSIRVR